MPNRARQIIPFPKTEIGRPPVKVKAKATVTKRRRWPVLFLCVILTVYLVAAGAQWVRQERRLRDLTAQYEAMLVRQQQLHNHNELMQQQIQRLLEDPVYLEQLAREMGMVRPGDTIYISTDLTP